VLLITHDHLRGFYESAGFEWLGESKVVHGSKVWYDMRNDLTDSLQKTSQIQQLPPGVLDALQRRTLFKCGSFVETII
jgi:guanine nucleotide exchange factor